MNTAPYAGGAVGLFMRGSRGNEAIRLRAILEARKLDLSIRCAIARMVTDRPKSQPRSRGCRTRVSMWRGQASRNAYWRRHKWTGSDGAGVIVRVPTRRPS